MFCYNLQTITYKLTIKSPAYIKKQNGRLFRIELYDNIYIKRLNERKIQIIKTEGYKIPTNNQNPVYQIAAELQKMKPNKFGSEIKIEKNIPTFSGLSSQLSNAAEVLKILNNIWDINLKDIDLLKIGEKIDPDISKLLKTISDKPKNVILVRPKYIKNEGNWNNKKFLKHFPDIGHIIDKLNGLGCYESGISGNGPMIYGFTENKITENILKKEIGKKLDFIWIGKTS